MAFVKKLDYVQGYLLPPSTSSRQPSKGTLSDPKSLAGRPLDHAQQLGQVSTPSALAHRMASRLLHERPSHPIALLDPCVGPATFLQALKAVQVLRPGDQVVAFDLDPAMVHTTTDWEAPPRVHFQVREADYLTVPMPEQFDYAILNPPYIRQEWLDNKIALQSAFHQRYGVHAPGTSNLYVYFIVKTIMDLKPGGAFACIVYDSWQSTRFGQWLAAFLHLTCSSIDIEPVGDQPFYNRLIDATLIFGIKREQIDSGACNDLRLPAIREHHTSPLADVAGFCTLDEAFVTRRGLRLKQADFFLCPASEVDRIGATPFVKKVARLEGYHIPAGHVEAALLITEHNENSPVYDELQRRLRLAMERKSENISILTWFRERPSSWYLHRPAPYAPILFNYYLRNRPRHIYNPKWAYADNFYGLVNTDDLSSLAWLALLNSTAVCTEILARARNQGNGLAKLQLFEYRGVYVPDLRKCSEAERAVLHALGDDLVAQPRQALILLERIDQVIATIFADPRLEPARLNQLYQEINCRARKPKEA